ncbi:MAG TPA: hypothetical protein VGM90_39025 [Kofleriaceae bacterium]
MDPFGPLAFLVVAVVYVRAMLTRSGVAARMREEIKNAPAARTEYARRLLKHVERKTIAQLEEGQAAVVVGKARAIPGVALLYAPIHGVDVIAVNTRVEANRGVELGDRWACVDFDLVDASGSIRVQGAGVDVAIVNNVAYTTDGQKLPPEMVLARARNTDAVGTEGIIRDGTDVLVLGQVSLDRTITDYRDGGQLRILRATESFPVALSCDADLFVRGDHVLTMEDVIRRKRTEER